MKRWSEELKCGVRDVRVCVKWLAVGGRGEKGCNLWYCTNGCILRVSSCLLPCKKLTVIWSFEN